MMEPRIARIGRMRFWLSEKNRKNSRAACSLSAKGSDDGSVLSACEQAPTANSDSSSMQHAASACPSSENTAFGSQTSHPDGNIKQCPFAALQRDLKRLGLWHFAGAVMYVLYEVLGLPAEKQVVPIDVKRGKLLLSEIIDGGNFGKYASKYGNFTQQRMAKKHFLKIWRNMHFVRYYPAEALCEPIFRTWHFFWRMKNK